MTATLTMPHLLPNDPEQLLKLWREQARQFDLVSEAISKSLLEQVNKPELEPEEKPLNTKELAEELGYSSRTIIRWRLNGMPSHDLNGRKVFYLSEVNEYIKSL